VEESKKNYFHSLDEVIPLTILIEHTRDSLGRYIKMPSKATLEACLSRYSSSLETKQSSTSRSSNLVELDTWFRSSSLRNSMWDKGYALDKDELVKLMDWKLSVSFPLVRLSLLTPLPRTLSPLLLLMLAYLFTSISSSVGSGDRLCQATSHQTLRR